MRRRQRSGIDHNALLTLRTLLRERSVTGAAQSLYLSQQAVSGALNRLREHYDDPLLVRAGQGYRLTPLGEELLREADAAVTALDDALRPVSQAAVDDPDRVFSVVASDHAMGVLTGPLIAAFSQLSPEMTVTFVPYTPGDITDPAELLVHDVVIAPLGDPVPGRSRALLHDDLVCIVDAQRPGIQDGRISAAQLRALRYIPAARVPAAEQIDRVLLDAGIVDRPAISVAGLLSLPLLIPGSEAFTIVPSRIAADWVAAGQVAVVSIPSPLPRITEAVFWHPARDDDPAVQWLLDTLTAVAESLAVDAG